MVTCIINILLQHDIITTIIINYIFHLLVDFYRLPYKLDFPAFDLIRLLIHFLIIKVIIFNIITYILILKFIRIFISI